MTRVLRDYQLEAVDAIRSAWKDGMLRPAIVLPTGCGKTDVIAQIATDAARDGANVLALAHRGELLDQIAERCRMHAPDLAVGRVQAERDERWIEDHRRIVVAMTPTLASQRRRDRLPRPDLVIVDECHHAAAPRDMAILAWAGSFDRTPTMGVTATMIRGDRRGLKDVWQDVVYDKDIRWAIDAGWLVEPKGRAVVVDHLDLNKAKTSRGDYQDGELGAMVAQDVDQIVQAWREHASDRITVAFTPNVASAQALADEFRAANVPVGEVYGTTGRAERDRTYRALARGEIRVLVSVMVTTEGWDCPPVSCILQARPTKLPGLYQQIVGRGLRTSPGKRDCLVLDVVGASRSQKLITLIDLHETAEYNVDELDVLPCEECGGAPRGQRLTEAAPHQCTCGDGAGVDARIHLQGPAEYVDVDLFETSRLNWLFTRGGIRFLPAGDRMVALWPEGDEDGALFSPGHCTVRGYDKGRFIGRDGKALTDHSVPLHHARELAEAWALAHDASVGQRLSTRGASWRRGADPTDAQLGLAHRMGIVGAEDMSKARLSDEISIVFASEVLD